MQEAFTVCFPGTALSSCYGNLSENLLKQPMVWAFLLPWSNGWWHSGYSSLSNMSNITSHTCWKSKDSVYPNSRILIFTPHFRENFRGTRLLLCEFLTPRRQLVPAFDVVQLSQTLTMQTQAILDFADSIDIIHRKDVCTDSSLELLFPSVLQGMLLTCNFLKGHGNTTIVSIVSKYLLYVIEEWLSEKHIFNHAIWY